MVVALASTVAAGCIDITEDAESIGEWALPAADRPTTTSDGTVDVTDTADQDPLTTTAEANPPSTDVGADPPVSDPPVSDPPADEPGGSEASAPTGRASDLYALVAVLYEGEVDDEPSRHVGETTRCVAARVGDDALAAGATFARLRDGDPDSVDIATLDPAVVGEVAGALDVCIPAAALIVADASRDDVERSRYWYAECLVGATGDGLPWADIVAERTAGNDDIDGYLFATLDERHPDACRVYPGEDEELAAAEEALIDPLRDLTVGSGLELTSDEITCVVVESRGQVDANLVIDLDNPDLESLTGVLDALDGCVPLGGVIGEYDDAGVITALCIDRELDGVVGWYELSEFGLRTREADLDAVRADPVFQSIEAARSACNWAPPSSVVAELGEIIEIDVLEHDGTRLWAGGVDEGGGAQPGNLVVIDGATGEVVSAFETEPFSVEIITSDGENVWIAGEGSETLQRVRPDDGTVDAPVTLTGREIGALELTPDALWATDNLAGSLLRLDPASGEVLDELPIAALEWFSSDLLFAAGSLWLTDREEPVVRRLDPSTGELQNEFAVESEFTMHLLDMGDGVGVYGFGELWTIDADATEAVQVVGNFGWEGLDVDAATAIGDLVVFAQEDVATLVAFDAAVPFVQSMHAVDGLFDSGRGIVVTDGTAVWATTYSDDLVLLER